jgi:NAD(P)-dependent dehydrogenase (short-subunit alcohol dehydrogenase family)
VWQLENKVVIVTVASSGIGKTIALALTGEGAAVTVDYVGKGDEAEAVVAQIQDMGDRAVAFRADVAERAKDGEHDDRLRCMNRPGLKSRTQ